LDFQDNENNNAELMNIFGIESEELLEKIFESLSQLEKKPADKAIVTALYREMHSIKGAVRMVGFNNIQTIFHKIEDIFDVIKTSEIVLDKDKINLITKNK
jgi:chemotaxis protein histidine kinase CheA